MDDLLPVSTVDPEDRTLFIIISMQTFLDDLSKSEVYFPTASPAQLLSDGNQFYEVPLLLTPSDVGASLVNVDTNCAPTSATGASLIALPHLLATPTPSAAAGAGVAAHLVSPPASSTSTANTGVIAPQTALSDGAARAEVEAYIRTSSWFRLHAKESRVGELGVPVSASQLAKRDQSIWACLFKRIRRKGRLVFKCTACGHESDRLNRAVSHQRAKWGHKPFACTDAGW